MIRTKDLVLFVVVLVMLLLAISATVAKRMIEQGYITNNFSAGEDIPDYNAIALTPPEPNRSETIDRLRSQLAAGDVIEASPSVEDTPATTSTPSSASGTALDCPDPDTGIDVARSWPLKNLAVKTTGSARVVAEVQTGLTTGATASGTLPAPAIINERVLLQLPLLPQRLPLPVCLDSEIIGVTLGGSLMFKGDAVLYRNTPPETLIGYARDGFPIYGAYAGERDQCGGYVGATGYRYAVAPDSAAIMTCFSGTPQSFIR